MNIQSSDVTLQSNPTIDLIHAHRSIRSFKPLPVADYLVETIIETAQWAPSTCFRQVYSVIAVRSPETKRELRRVCGDQKWVEECPVFLAFCADLNRLDDICKASGGRVNLEHTETFLMAALDTALFMQNAATAAEALGLGMVMIGGLRDNPREVIKLLQLPHGVIGIAGMCLGFAETIPQQRPRLPLAEVLHHERYQSDGRQERLASYDEIIRGAGTYKRKNAGPQDWTEVMARTTSKPPPEEGRYELREILNEQGFEMK
ncbi:MAG TPA: NADPH-dependent oxidoreductase [Anaerolineales bacterium]